MNWYLQGKCILFGTLLLHILKRGKKRTSRTDQEDCEGNLKTFIWPQATGSYPPFSCTHGQTDVDGTALELVMGNRSYCAPRQDTKSLLYCKMNAQEEVYYSTGGIINHCY